MLTCPHCHQDLYPRNPGLLKIRNLLVVVRDINPRDYELHLDLQTECELASVRTWEVGNDIASGVFRDGVRIAMSQIYGYRAVWNAPSNGFVPASSGEGK